MTANRSKIPAEGERRAVYGYDYQYRVSADLIFKAFRELQWVRIADPEAGRVDDLLIGTTSRVDAYQIKGDKYGGNFTYRDLIKPQDKAPCLIAQLADGWKRLNADYPTSRIVVHLVTAQHPSTSTQASIPIGDIPPNPPHFSAFIEQAWKPAKGAPCKPSENVPVEWLSAWETLQEAGGLTADEFDHFVKDCELEFSIQLPEAPPNPTPEQVQYYQDLEHIKNALPGFVASPERVIKLYRQQLLQRLGWSDRYELKNPHEFPAPQIPYQPIRTTVAQLHQAIDSLPGGYIAVSGSPGSGKSTLLSETLRFWQGRIIPYYCYIPDAQKPQVLSGESENFLHDIVLHLDRAGFQVGQGSIPVQREYLLRRFHQQIHLLHKNYLETGTKTIILIDGLDHIEREQNPQRSLLEDLPEPGQVLDGVYIILGSQTDDPFPGNVQASVRRSERRINIESLSREAVHAILNQIVLPVTLMDEQKDNIYQYSDGHPLALELIIRQIRGTANPEEIDQIFKKTEIFKGDIEDLYHSHWIQFESDAELKHLFGLIARLRARIDMSWVETWTARGAIHLIRTKFSHYFNIEDPDRWTFYHNSFRLFLLDRTGEFRPGYPDQERDRRFHNELAERCTAASDYPRQAWEELYHRYSASDHESVLQCAGPDRFRSQLLAFRPIDAIRTDIKLALRSAAALQDPVALLRLILTGSALADRESYLEKGRIAAFLLDLDENQIAVDHIRDGRRLRVEPATALNLSIKLKRKGLNEEARKVFDLAEPLDSLSGSPIVNDTQGSKADHLIAWAEAAVHFRDLSEIISAISRAQHGGDAYNQLDEEKATEILRKRLILRTGLSLIHERRWDDHTVLEAEFDLTEELDRQFWFRMRSEAWRICAENNESDRAEHFLYDTISKIDGWQLSDYQRLDVAEGIHRVLGNEELVKQWLKDIPQPDLSTDPYAKDSGTNAFLFRLRLNRLLYLLGNQQLPTEIVPDSKHPDHEGLVLFERAICKIAQIAAQGLSGDYLDGNSVDRVVTPLLRLFYQPWERTRYWTNSHFILGTRGHFYNWLIEAVALHGSKATESLRLAFDREWNDPETTMYWHVDLRRDIILALKDVGVDRSWLIERLSGLENGMYRDLDISGRIEACQAQIAAWIKFDEKEQAQRRLRDLMTISSGVGYRKDYQLDDWIKWLAPVNEIEPDQAAGRISWLARAIVPLEETTEGKAADSAARALLKVAFRYGPRRAIVLYNWFIEKGVIWHEEAIIAILKAALDAEDPPTNHVVAALFEYLLPIAKRAYPKIAEKVISRVASQSGPEKAVEVARQIVDSVDVHALPTNRSEWRNGTAKGMVNARMDPSMLGIDYQPFMEERDYSSRWLHIKDETNLHLEQVKERVSTVDDLMGLIDKATGNEYFDWHEVVEHLAEKLNADEVFQVAAIFQGNHRISQILAALSKRLFELGDPEHAWELAEEALEVSNTAGWDRSFDGGTKLVAFQALFHIAKEKARRLVYDTLVSDLTVKEWMWGNVARNFDEILTLLSDSALVTSIWRIIEQHLRELFESAILPEDEPPIDQSLNRDTPARAIVDYIIQHINHPVNILTQRAQHTCVHLLRERDQTLIAALTDYFDDEEHLEGILPVLDAASLGSPSVLTPFREPLKLASQSPSFAIRSIALRLLERAGWPSDESNAEKIELPEIYQLILPSPQIKGISGRTISSTEPLPDEDDPMQYIPLFKDQIRYLASETDVPESNITHRIRQIMQELEQWDPLHSESEEKFRRRIEGTGLKFPFIRLRIQIARRAIFHVIAELVDAGAIDRSLIPELTRACRYYDPVLIIAKQLKRPEYVASLSGLGVHQERSKEWFEQISESDYLRNGYQVGDITILAENAMLKRLSWEVPTEIRKTMIIPTREQWLDDAVREFGLAENWLTEDYSSLDVQDDPTPLVIQHRLPHGVFYDSPGTEWLALNPIVGKEMGWRLTNAGLFRWLNDENRVMVESIWWTDGFIGHGPPRQEEEVGEGWLVIATPEAWHELQTRFNELCKCTQVHRHYTELKDNQAIDHHKTVSGWQRL